MTRLVIDSSALAKRYVAEPGSDAVIEVLANASEVVLSILVVPELLSAFNRLQRQRHLSPVQYASLKRDFLMDLDEATVVAVGPALLPHATTVVEGFVVRALDALHVGTALLAEAELFVTADNRQADAASALGLRVLRVG